MERDGSASAPLVPQARLSSGADQGLPDFYTIKRTAEICLRSEKRIRNLVSEFQLRTKTAWTVYRRHRRRVIMLDAASVAWLREITLFRNERLSHAMLRERTLAPICNETVAAKYPCAMAHYARLCAHPAFAPDIGPYLRKLYEAAAKAA